MTRPDDLLALPVKLVRWSRRVRITARFGKRARWGHSFIAGPHLRLGSGRSLIVGDRVTIGPNFHCMSNLQTGDDVMISGAVAVIGDDHSFDDPEHTIQTQGTRPHSTVRLEGDNFIGYGTIILGDVVIGRGAIVGAGSLVTGVLPPDMVCVGRPARPVRPRYGPRPASGPDAGSHDVADKTEDQP